MFISTLNLILELRKHTIELDIIKQHLQQHSLMNEIEINALIELTKQIKESVTDDQQRVGILNEINAILFIILQEKRDANSNTNYFLNYVQQSNQNNIGIAILNNNGQFILTDQLTRNILELSILKLEHTLLKQVKGTIKRLLPFITWYCKGNILTCHIFKEKQTKNKQKKQRKQKKSQKESVDKETIQQEVILMAKYLKSLQITIQRTNLQLHDDFIEFFKDSNDILLHNLSSLTSNKINSVVVCEIFELDQHLNFNVEELLSDPYIKKNEIKWFKLVRKLGGQLQTYEDYIK